MSARTFQDVIQTLNRYWAAQGCVLLQPLDTEVGAGTFHPASSIKRSEVAAILQRMFDTAARKNITLN